MTAPTIIMGILAICLVSYGYTTGAHIEGMKNTFNMSIQIIPLLFFSFTIAGMMQVLVSTDGLTKWVGPESGFKGILIGTLVGGLTPGGPFVSLPIVAGFIHSGAGIGTVVAFMTSWSIWAVMRLPLEIGILGWKFTIVRLASSAILPILAGVIANVFFSWVHIN
ncbi:permease [Desulfoluna spongiiphila]|uniref:Predicted permease n=1 Tax=Desulfoluna spongiiphila TaxID=419481 RepID=A0A1G5HBN9_9BACT|nr:permease [Desulfoluna spongiiphila]SCY61186.1 Predicted permease [Desulfoluna spongiiphila]VVS94607.1 predicted permease duf318 [Desulfoluna spongiiphila]